MRVALRCAKYPSPVGPREEGEACTYHMHMHMHMQHDVACPNSSAGPNSSASLSHPQVESKRSSLHSMLTSTATISWVP